MNRIIKKIYLRKFKKKRSKIDIVLDVLKRKRKIRDRRGFSEGKDFIKI